MQTKWLLYILAPLLLVSCYQQETGTSDAWTDEQDDSVSFYTTHHYTVDYNFVVKADSIHLVVQQPSEVVNGMMVDTIVVDHGDVLVVTDVSIMPTDTVDSVWVQVARDPMTIGWAHESQLLTGATPDNPISQFIDFFSNKRLLIIAAILVVVVAVLVVYRLLHHRAKMVHFNDIDSFYPTALALLVAASSVFFTTIQMVEPESWRHYYYHPTLNPFIVPLHIAFFVASIWGIIVVAIATFSDVQRRLTATQAFIYYVGLLGVCSFNYVVFGITTYYYIGYPLLAAYVVFALWRYYRYSRARYVCGHCGERMHQKGICPRCGMRNV